MSMARRSEQIGTDQVAYSGTSDVFQSLEAARDALLNVQG